MRLRQQTLSLGSVNLRQQNKLFKNYCKPSPPPPPPPPSQILANPQ